MAGGASGTAIAWSFRRVSSFSANSASVFNSGGAIYNFGSLTLTNAAIFGNSAANGAGVYNTGALTVTNATVSGNSARSSGGGIDNVGTLTLTPDG